MRVRNLLSLAIAGVTLVATAAPAAADSGIYHCNSYAVSPLNSAWNICVNVDGGYRGAIVNFVNGNTSQTIDVSVSSVYLSQCDGYGHNCGVIAANKGSGTAYPNTCGAATVEGCGNFYVKTSLKPVSFGHTYKACFSGTTQYGYTHTNYCSPFWTN